MYLEIGMGLWRKLPPVNLAVGLRTTERNLEVLSFIDVGVAAVVILCVLLTFLYSI